MRVQRRFRGLRETSPADSLLVRFELAPEPADERADMASLFAQLLQAGWKPEAATVAEAMGFAVEEAGQSLPVTLDAASGHPLPELETTRPEVLENRDEVPNTEVPEREEEPVDDGGEALTPEELEALRSLAEVSLDDLVAQDTETAEAALTEAVEGASDEDAAADDEWANRTYKRDRNGQFASTGAAQHRPGHSRASKGNPKNPTTQSNTPLKAAPGARPQEKVDAMARSIKRTAEHGGTARDVAKIGDKMMTVPHGRAGRKNDRYAGGYGTAHQQSKHGKKRRCHSAESGKGNGVRPA